MQRGICLTVVLAVLAGPALAQTSTLRLLNERIPEVSFQEVPFDQVMDWVSEYTGANVVVRWQALELLGIERDKPVSIRVRNLRLSQVLWMIMNEAGGTDVKLAYRASGNLLVLSTAEDLGQEMLVRVYDVGDLLVRVPRFFGGPRIDLSQQTGGGGGGAGGGGGGGGQGVFGGGQGGGGQQGDDEQQQGQQQQQGPTPQMLELIELITQTIEPDSWVDNGGLGTIQAFGRQLVVRNNIGVHQALGGPVADVD